MLVVADELERRLPPGDTVESVVIAPRSNSLTVATPAWTACRRRGLATTMVRWVRATHPDICRLSVRA